MRARYGRGQHLPAGRAFRARGPAAAPRPGPGPRAARPPPWQRRAGPGQPRPAAPRDEPPQPPSPAGAAPSGPAGSMGLRMQGGSRRSQGAGGSVVAAGGAGSAGRSRAVAAARGTRCLPASPVPAGRGGAGRGPSRPGLGVGGASTFPAGECERARSPPSRHGAPRSSGAARAAGLGGIAPRSCRARGRPERCRPGRASRGAGGAAGEGPERRGSGRGHVRPGTGSNPPRVGAWNCASCSRHRTVPHYCTGIQCCFRLPGFLCQLLFLVNFRLLQSCYSWVMMDCTLCVQHPTAFSCRSKYFGLVGFQCKCS